MTQRSDTIIHKLVKHNSLAKPPVWLPDSLCYVVDMGSHAYGCHTEKSDFDIYGFCIPEKSIVFPHLAGEILGFGTEKKRFEQWQAHHMKMPDGNIDYDVQIYSIIKYFHLCMTNNPNMLDSLFVPDRCIRYINNIGKLVRENRHKFLHRGCYHKFKGYAYSQLHKMKTKSYDDDSSRRWMIEQFGYDTKYSSHLVRLALECEQILTECDLDIERNRELLKTIRRGDWTEEQVYQWFGEKDKQLDDLYHKSPLPYSPDESFLRSLLTECLHAWYNEKIIDVDTERVAQDELRALRDRLNSLTFI